MMPRASVLIELPRRRQRDCAVGIPPWMLTLQFLTGAALALTWLLTLHWQLQCIADAAHCMAQLP